jgi:hypothetical protein
MGEAGEQKARLFIEPVGILQVQNDGLTQALGQDQALERDQRILKTQLRLYLFIERLWRAQIDECGEKGAGALDFGF